MIHSPDYVFTVLVSIFISKFHSHLEYCMHIANVHTMYAHMYVQTDKPTPPAHVSGLRCQHIREYHYWIVGHCGAGHVQSVQCINTLRTMIEQCMDL